MSIKIDWPVMAADTLTLYWADTAFTPDTLPGNKTTLTPSASTYTDTTVAAGSNRYYMVEAVKAGANTQYSQCMLFGNWAKTGPGGNVVLRGNWDAGYMGLVPVAQMFTISQLRTALNVTNMGTAPADSTVTGWYKFVVKGKILFIPTNTFCTTGVVTWSLLYNQGLIYGVDGPGAAPIDLVASGANPAIAGPVNQKRVVTVGTDSFLVRAPKISTLATNQNVPDRASYKDSEWWLTMCMLSTVILPADIPLLSPLKWGDVISGNPYQVAATQHFIGTSSLALSTAYWSDTLARTINGTPAASWVSWIPVLEYIPA